MRRFVYTPTILALLTITILVCFHVGYHQPFRPTVPVLPSHLHLGDRVQRGISCDSGNGGYGGQYYPHFADKYCWDDESGSMVDIKEGHITAVHLYTHDKRLTLGEVIAEWGSPRWQVNFPSYAPDVYWDDKHVITISTAFNADTAICCVIFGESEPEIKSKFVEWKGFVSNVSDH